MILDHLQESQAVFFQFPFTDAGDTTELAQGLGQDGAHLLQRTVVEDHVGRDALLFRQLPAAVAQGLPQCHVDVYRQGCPGLPLGGAFTGTVPA